ncbi:MAG: signal peptidase II [Erysipelothrix sp.]|nr:signal peptidase II [Erysipelothrix sp.]
MKKRDILILLAVIIIDQVTKIMVFNLNKDNIEIVKGFFSLTKVKNSGAAWGLFSGYMWLFFIVSIIALYFMLKLYKKSLNKDYYFSFALILMIGGTLGNLIDRLLFGYVRDFLNFIIFTYDYPVFNVADMALVIGVGLVILFLIKNPEEELI